MQYRFDILEGNKIPYPDQARKLFNLYAEDLDTVGEQQIIPFLGAGASISARPPNSHKEPEPKFPNPLVIDGISTELGFSGKARAFLEIAILIGCLLQSSETGNPQTNEDLLQRLKDGEYPPSAGELAGLFSELSAYTGFEGLVKDLRARFPQGLFATKEADQIEAMKLVARVTGIADPPDALASITSYFESKAGRRSVWENLRLTLANKKSPAPIHKLLACSAAEHLDGDGALDYLILTTNYDSLMEQALEDRGVPYVVLLTRNQDGKVAIRCSSLVNDPEKLVMRNSDRFPNNFTLLKSQRLCVLYKVHGCVDPRLTLRDDAIVISDKDYVNYISRMSTNDGAIPSYVTDLMRWKPFIFLGYSLSDWNVRSIFETVRGKRGEEADAQDYAVMHRVREFEKIFFQTNNVIILKTDLNAFVSGVLSHLPEDHRRNL
jgi:hypothetical protein